MIPLNNIGGFLREILNLLDIERKEKLPKNKRYIPKIIGKPCQITEAERYGYKAHKPFV
jgi:hypothetical protein